MTREELISIARSNAEIHQLPQEIVCGMCERESTWNTQAKRFEQGFYDHYLAKQVQDGKLELNEAKNRCYSYGLMQVLGEVARERGYLGEFQKICDDADLGCQLGCKHLVHLLGVHEGNMFKALLSYNGGANHKYPQEVIDLSGHYKENA